VLEKIAVNGRKNARMGSSYQSLLGAQLRNEVVDGRKEGQQLDRSEPHHTLQLDMKRTSRLR
jgi:hypothetical protein